jgi:hypothetical protein
MNLSKEEKTIQKKLSVLSGACLIGALIFPPLALVSGAVLVGQAGRAYRTRDSGNDEVPETEPIRNVSPNRRYEENSFIPESPETAIARRNDTEASGLLREISKDKVTTKAYETASLITRDYLNSIPSEQVAKSNGITVSYKRKRDLSGLLWGEDTGFDLNINLK